jgi:hypothetical protein
MVAIWTPMLIVIAGRVLGNLDRIRFDYITTLLLLQ